MNKDVFTLRIEMGGDDMRDEWDIAAALRRAADTITNAAEAAVAGSVYDGRGRVVGDYQRQQHRALRYRG